ITIDAKVPGGVYGSLMDSGKLTEGDFYYRFNDINYRNYSYRNWTYFTSFEVPSNIWSESRIILEFLGLDTVSDVILNGRLVGKSVNMFARYIWDVTSYLKKENEQTLEIEFQSPVEWSRKAYEKQAQDYEVPPKCIFPSFKGECHANHIRKMQSSFAWDWGPAFPNMGIWKPWNLIGFSSLRIKDILIFTKPTSPIGGGGKSRFDSVGWIVKLKVVFDAAVINKKISGKIRVDISGNTHLVKKINVTPKRYKIFIEEKFKVSKGILKTWWPNGYGNQPLYDLTVTWSADKTHEENHKTIIVGFRTVELDQSYVKPKRRVLGSNWVPSHVLPERMNQDYMNRLLIDAADTHQNCIRVWGGGIYESDEFYKTANELGILIWQDFMFACSMYPTNAKFLNSVAHEVETQVHRLQHHPSILVWGGNNENEQSLRENRYATAGNFRRYKEDYIKLYVDVIKNLVEAADDSRPFVVSSPSNGILTEEEDYVAENPEDNLYEHIFKIIILEKITLSYGKILILGEYFKV
ncbi:Beta-mannosidase, partial [Armadillidium nasatum]